MKNKKILFLIMIFIVVAVSVAMLNWSNPQWQEENRSAKIKFSHKLHISQGVECTDCHTTASKSTSSSDKLFGDHSSCQTCHDDQITNDCMYCHTEKDNYIAFDNPDREVIFSHEKHVNLSNVTCETCHKNLATVDYGSSKNLPTMTMCNDCHDNSMASNQCEVCHTNFESLLPADHREFTFRKDHQKLVRVGSMEISCSNCHGEEFCQQCHDGANLIKFGERGLMADPTPRSTRRDSPKMLTLQMVHDLNYRFTHSIEAKSKASDCYTCHERETFCSSCHMAGGNITQNQFKPLWHDESNFTTLGVGSGGGSHAEFAKRDIETCVACHDVNGADATCLKCHYDQDGIKGTNPRTHPRGYLQDEKGIWHDTDGATCYVCHTNPNARVGGNKNGGFCNYCHI